MHGPWSLPPGKPSKGTRNWAGVGTARQWAEGFGCLKDIQDLKVDPKVMSLSSTGASTFGGQERQDPCFVWCNGHSCACQSSKREGGFHRASTVLLCLASDTLRPSRGSLAVMQAPVCSLCQTARLPREENARRQGAERRQERSGLSRSITA